MNPLHSRSFLLVLLAIVCLAALFRIWGISYGLPCTYARPDEDFLIITSLRLSADDLNPHFSDWPAMFFYITRATLEGAARLWPGVEDAVDLYETRPAQVFLLLRWLFFAMGIATVALLAQLGRRLFSPGVGLTGALFLSVAFLHVRESHFALLDIPATLFGVLFFLAAAGVLLNPRPRHYLIAGLWCGMAAGTKYFGALLLFPLVAAHVMAWRAGRARLFSPWIAASGLAAAAVFLLGSPHFLLDMGSAWHDIIKLREVQYTTDHFQGPGLGSQRGGIHHLTFSLRYGLGLPLELAGLAGFLLAFLRGTQRRQGIILLASFFLPFYLLTFTQTICFMRYVTMLLPGLCLSAAMLLETLTRLLPASQAQRLHLALAAAMAIDPAWRSLQLDLLLSRPDTRNISFSWMEQTIPQNAVLLYSTNLLFPAPFPSHLFPRRILLPIKQTFAAVEPLQPFAAHGINYSLIVEHPLPIATLDPRARAALTNEGKVVFDLQGCEMGDDAAIYDPFDAFFLPVARFDRVTLPGPNITIRSIVPHEQNNRLTAS